MATRETTIEPVRKRIRVASGIDHAFRTFTEGIGSWWPLETHSLTAGEDGSNPPETVVFESSEGGRVFERTRDGRECDWGTVLVYEPPKRVVLEWAVVPSSRTEVEVRFQPDGDGTLVELEHRGWEHISGGDEKRASYDSGWPGVLERFAQAV